MQIDCHQVDNRVDVKTETVITKAEIVTVREEWVMRESLRHQYVFIKRVRLVLAEFLHVTRTQDLCMHFEKLMSRVNSAVRFFRRIPEIQLEPVWPGRC